MSEYRKRRESATKSLQEYFIRWKREFETGVTHHTGLGKLETIQNLCQEGADLNILERQKGISCIPSVFRDPELILFLISKGRSVNFQDENGDTALHLAIKYGLNDENIKFLLEKGANPNIINNEGETALLVLVKNEKQVRRAERITSLAQLLIDWGADAGARGDGDGESTLHSVVRRFTSDRYLLNFFLKKHPAAVDVRNSKSLREQTPLMLAAQSGNSVHCRMLIERGSNVNAGDQRGWTPLHYAVTSYGPNPDCIDVFMKAGADPNIRSSSGRDVFELAYFHDNTFISAAICPAKQVQLYEMTGALAIMGKRENRLGLMWWKMAYEMCTKSGLVPSEELLQNYRMATTLDFTEIDVNRAAMATMYRISTGSSKLWNVLCAFNILFKVNTLYQIDNAPIELEILDFVLEKTRTGEEFNFLDDMDIDALSSLVRILDSHKLKLSIDVVVSYVHCIAQLAIGWLSRWVLQTYQSEIPHFKTICLDLCFLLKWVHFSVVPEEVMMENERLLRALLDLDPRDQDGNGILHETCRQTDYKFIDTIIDLGANVESMNQVGVAPIQMIEFKGTEKAKDMKVIKKMVETGAHLDSSDVVQRALMRIMTEKEKLCWFPCNSCLKCKAAKVLIRSRTNYKNAVLHSGRKVPRKIVNFINMHVYQH